MMKRQLLIIFYRNPELGKVKTRLAHSVGEEQALAIYLKMVAHTRMVASSVDVDRVVYYSEYVDTEDNWLNEIFDKELQTGVDLGERMCKAFHKGFQQGYESICLIGTDCPELSVEILNQAFDALNNHPGVIGPARDGGYYLIGMNALLPSAFEGKQWSTASVCNDTLKDFAEAGWKVYQLPTLADVDEGKDLSNLRL
jgi:rSAM/selenodomain-associated transferase 1